MKAAFVRLMAMIYKEFVYVWRDRKMRIVIVAVPVIQAVILGYAANTDLREVKTAFVDYDNSPASSQLASAFFSGEIFRKAAETDIKTAEEMMLSGDVSMIVRVPAGFERRLAAGEAAPVQILLDSTNSVNAAAASGYAEKAVASFNAERWRKYAPELSVPGVRAEYRVWFNENFESREFFVPSMLAMLLLIVAVMLSGMAIVQEKESGTLEQLSVSPVSSWEFIAGKCVPFAVISLLDVLLITAVAVGWFHIELKGSFAFLLLASTFYIFSTLGIGLLISAVSSTQQQAMMATFMVVFPVILLSGFAFPVENMPETVRYATYLNPMRYYLEIIRGVFMKGTGPESLFFETAVLGVLGAVYLGGSAVFLHKKLK